LALQRGKKIKERQKNSTERRFSSGFLPRNAQDHPRSADFWPKNQESRF
jgi:hypothetical protein